MCGTALEATELSSCCLFAKILEGYCLGEFVTIYKSVFAVKKVGLVPVAIKQVV